MSSSILKKSAHIRYHLRCLKTFLPTAYTSNDSQRMTLAFFTLCALDLLGALDAHTTAAERSAYADWIYRCQHPDGGFRGFTGADVGDNGRRTEGNHQWDPANIAATYFALVSLAILGDDLARVRGPECLAWLKRLQLRDGTFGEALSLEEEVQGGRDMRFCFCAAVIRWILRGEEEAEAAEEDDIDVDGLMRFFEASQTYEGGFANGPFHEAHAGWTSCAVGAMSLLGKLPTTSKDKMRKIGGGGNTWPSTESIDRLLGWLVSRQTSVLQEEDSPEPEGAVAIEGTQPPSTDGEADQDGATPEDSTIEPSEDELRIAGISGRCNKAADTCYAFWAGGSLMVTLKRQPFDDLKAK
ncbi:MAG: hypothetical protein LQ348_002001 [Seirophora lacunosa]|nr:MAG: hypothetical protein LQ348_002001 [Seirophora lacunosa]